MRDQNQIASNPKTPYSSFSRPHFSLSNQKNEFRSVFHVRLVANQQRGRKGIAGGVATAAVDSPEEQGRRRTTLKVDATVATYKGEALIQDLSLYLFFDLGFSAESMNTNLRQIERSVVIIHFLRFLQPLGASSLIRFGFSLFQSGHGNQRQKSSLPFRSLPGFHRYVMSDVLEWEFPPIRLKEGNMTTMDEPETFASDNDHISRVKVKRHELEQMKDRFAKLLLKEDMSGGGKGVSSALALSNAITNLAASAFGEQRKLAPMPEDRKNKWRREIGWLLSVTDYIVEFVPSQQTSKGGSNKEVMTTRQRCDLRMNILALKKLDAMLIGCLDNFKNQKEFWYVSKDANESEKGVQRSDKWWLPTVKVPPKGLSEESRKWMQYQKDCVNQVLKASMAINAEILSEMEIPDNYIDNLPKNGRESLGDSIYKCITVDSFDPSQLLSTMDLSTEINVLDLKNKIEASIVIWKRKMNHKDSKSSWSTSISMEKRELFEDRAETILLLLKQQFPGLPQSSLEISKIEYNKDVGHAILESYSRVLESLANTVMNRIEDVLYADNVAQDPSLLEKKRTMSSRRTPDESKGQTPGQTPTGSPTSMTLSDFMGWSVDQETNSPKSEDKETEKYQSKSAKILARTKNSYMEKLEAYKLRSPTTRH
ncbi:hypothetical protein SSX86_021472 [Deinandra increscens subsp. villosa]|uniref:PRONE domain-containing protein n=1 Tax=Deinandra increscens subsp. villosa TaxID=3103831 RepID=A0AAP0GT56_9ASTR